MCTPAGVGLDTRPPAECMRARCTAPRCLMVCCLHCYLPDRDTGLATKALGDASCNGILIHRQPHHPLPTSTRAVPASCPTVCSGSGAPPPQAEGPTANDGAPAPPNR